MRSLVRSLLLSGVATVLATTPVWSQSSGSGQEVDLAINYSALRSNLTPGNFFWPQGGTIELSAEAFRGFGVAMNVTGLRATNLLNTGIDLNTITSTFGPRYTWHRRSGKIAVFGQGLIGESRAWNSFFPEAGGALSEYDAFALQAGGGVDLRLTRHLGIRPVQADWIRTQFPNATTNVQNNLRLGAGLVLRLQR